MFLKESSDSDMFGDTLGGRIVYAREAADLTTSQLARRLGVKTTTLHGWETDRAEPRSNRLLMISGMLNVSPTWLLTGAGESPIDTPDEAEFRHLRGIVSQLREQVLTIGQQLEQLQKRLDTYRPKR